ncbi:S-layer homology domain-containing protein [Candidatus Peregrinibacteria bacterium]|nr:MAG: S-layer homology domain-containing protein [Candidatus Peregrinibacteria bacterium]
MNLTDSFRRGLAIALALALLGPAFLIVHAEEDVTVDEATVADVEVILDEITVGDDSSLSEDVIEDALDDILDQVEDVDSGELDATLSVIESTIEDSVTVLESNGRPSDARLLRALKIRLRAEMIRRLHDSNDDRSEDRNDKDDRPRAPERRGLWEVRWGALDAARRDCATGSANDVLDALENGEVVPGCESERVDYEGTLSVDRGSLKVRKTVLFEKNDQVITDEGNSLRFQSMIDGHWDGLIVQYEPETSSSQSSALPYHVLVASTSEDDATMSEAVEADQDELEELQSVRDPSDRQKARIQELKDRLKLQKDRMQGPVKPLKMEDSTLPRPALLNSRTSDDHSVRDRLQKAGELRDRLMEKRQDRIEDVQQQMQANEPVMITLSLGTLSATLPIHEWAGRHDIGHGHFVEIRPLVNVGSGVSEANRERLIENKAKVRAKVSDVKEKVSRLRQIATSNSSLSNLESTVEDVDAYNFDDTSAAEVESELAALIAQLGDNASAEDIARVTALFQQKVARIKQVAKTRKFQQQIIPFRDTDDDQWYTGYVSGVKSRGIISGYKDKSGNELGEYRPSNDVTVAELFKIGLETAGEGPAASGEPSAAVARNHWAKLYVKRAEELGLNLASNLSDLNRPATRAEVIRFMLEAAGVDPGTCSSIDFSDVPRTHRHACFIQYAKELGIISGDDATGAFRPDEAINRAETAKIADKIIQTLLDQ